MLERFMSLRADKFEILRKKPAHEGYDFSFLISSDHLQKYKKEELINFIIEFIHGIDREVSDLKLFLSDFALCYSCQILHQWVLEQQNRLSDRNKG